MSALLWQQLNSVPALIVVAMLLCRYLPLPAVFQLRHWISLLVIAITQKVWRPDDSPAYQRLAGALMWLLLSLPPLLLLPALASYSAAPALLSLIVLWSCMDWPRHEFEAFTRCSARETQRQQLKPLLLRQVEQLTDAGLAKAAIESMSLRFAQQLLCPMLCFMIAGLPLLIFFTVSQAIFQQINPKRAGFSHYAWWPGLMTVLPIALSYRCLSLLVWLQSPTRMATKTLLSGPLESETTRRSHHMPLLHASKMALLRLIAIQIGRNTAGPRFYENIRVDIARLGPAIQPNQADVSGMLQRLTQLQFAIMLIFAGYVIAQILFLIHLSLQ